MLLIDFRLFNSFESVTKLMYGTIEKCSNAQTQTGLLKNPKRILIPKLFVRICVQSWMKS